MISLPIETFIAIVTTAVIGSVGATSGILWKFIKHLKGQIKFWQQQSKEEKEARRVLHVEVGDCEKKNSELMYKILEVVNKVEKHTNGDFREWQHEITNEVLKNRELILKNKN